MHPHADLDRRVEGSLQAPSHWLISDLCPPGGSWELAEASGQLGSRASCPELPGGLLSSATWVVCVLAEHKAAGVHSPLWGT